MTYPDWDELDREWSAWLRGGVIGLALGFPAGVGVGLVAGLFI